MKATNTAIYVTRNCNKDKIVQEVYNGESAWRREVKRAAGARQGAHRGWAVTLDEHCGRATGGVIAGLGFTLQQDDAARAAQAIAKRGSGDAGTDHGNVEFGGGRHRSGRGDGDDLILALRPGPLA